MFDQLLDFLSSTVFSSIVSLLILFSPFYFRRKHDIPTMSGLTTTLGIFGTFLGIFFGLIGFDVNDIAGSVPQLLGGLKTAFLTSIAGMLAGLLLKEFPGAYGLEVKPEDGASEEASIESMTAHLASIERIQKESLDQSSIQLRNIEKALVGEGETTLVTQIQKLRTSFSDKQDELKKAFEEFARQVAENNTKALINALTEVMRDFNAKINEQFGDNFKQLNSAVGKMLEWQAEYAKQVALMIDQINMAANGLERSEKSLDKVASHAEKISSVAVDLQRLLAALDASQQDLANKLKAFSDLADNAKGALPRIEQSLLQMTSELGKAFDRTITDTRAIIGLQLDATKQSTAQMQEAHRMVNGALTDMAKSLNTNIEQSMQKLTGDLSRVVERTVGEAKAIVALQLESTKQSTAQVQEANRTVNNALMELTKGLNGNIEKMMKENAERIVQQVTALDKQLGDELNKALQTLGSQLTSLSTHFVNDYRPLTEKLKEVVRLASNNGG